MKRKTSATQPEKPTASHPSHSNAMAKHAFARNESTLYYLVKDIEPREALEKIKGLILTVVDSGNWAFLAVSASERIDKQFDPRCENSLFGYWAIGMDEVYPDKTTNSLLARHTLDLIAEIIKAYHPSKRCTPDIFMALAEFFMLKIPLLATDHVPVATLWNSFLELPNLCMHGKGVHLIDAVTYGLAMAVEKSARRHIRPEDVLQLIIWTEKIGVSIDPNWITNKVMQILLKQLAQDRPVIMSGWVCMAKPFADHQALWRRGGVVSTKDLDGDCRQSVADICAFATAVDALPERLRALDLPFHSPDIRYDLKSCKLVSVTFTINSNCGKFTDLDTKKRSDMVLRAEALVVENLYQWATEIRLIGEFEVKIVGTFPTFPAETDDEKEIYFDANDHAHTLNVSTLDILPKA